MVTSLNRQKAANLQLLGAGYNEFCASMNFVFCHVGHLPDEDPVESRRCLFFLSYNIQGALMQFVHAVSFFFHVAHSCCSEADVWSLKHTARTELPDEMWLC